MIAALVVAGLASFAVAATLDVVAGVGRRAWRPVPYLVSAAGSGCLLAVGVLGVLGPGGAIGGDLLDVGEPLFVVDRLAGLFLTLSSPRTRSCSCSPTRG